MHTLLCFLSLQRLERLDEARGLKKTCEDRVVPPLQKVAKIAKAGKVANESDKFEHGEITQDLNKHDEVSFESKHLKVTVAK